MRCAALTFLALGWTFGVATLTYMRIRNGNARHDASHDLSDGQNIIHSGVASNLSGERDHA